MRSLVLILVVLMASCTTVKYVPIESVREKVVNTTDTLLQRDSVYVKDSVFCAIKGDTVYLTMWKEIVKNKYIYDTHDSIVYVHDSIDRPVIVEKPQSTIDKVRSLIGDICGIIVIIFLLCLVLRFLKSKL